jgi:uncharacterized membrane protein YdjX (TVP38/TMEM64 family)
MIGSLSWAIVGFLIASIAMTVGSLIFFALHLRGFLSWRKTEK